MNWPMTIPLVLPLLCAGIQLLAPRSPGFQRFIAVAGTGLLCLTGAWLVLLADRGEVLVHQVGSWEPPFGIVLVLDRFSAAMLFMSGLMGFTVTLFSGVAIDAARVRYGYYPVMMVLLTGVNGAFLTGDLFNMFVWFEVMLIASFVLLVLGGEKAQVEGAVKYVTLNLISSAVFLIALGLLYGLTGTLNMVDLGLRLDRLDNPGLGAAIAMLLLLSFGMKASVFPLFFWLPAAYHTPPIAVSALFSGLLTKVGVYALVRAFTQVFVQGQDTTQTILLWVAGFTMLTGVLGALSQFDVRRLLSFHIISQIGYMVMGLAIMSAASIAATIFFMVYHIAVKSSLFLAAGVMHRLRGTYDLKKMGGLYHGRPYFAFLFFVSAMALAGIPPLPGFFAKLGLVLAGMETGHYVIVAVALVTSIMTLYSMTKIWAEAFWKAPPEEPEEARERSDIEMGALADWLAPVCLLVAFTIALGVMAQPGIEYAANAAAQVLDRDAYVKAVLGGLP